MKKLLSLALSLLITTNAYAALTVGAIPKTKTGGVTPSLENSAISENSGTIAFTNGAVTTTFLKSTDDLSTVINAAADGAKIIYAPNTNYTECDAITITGKSMYIDFNGSTQTCATANNPNNLYTVSGQSATNFIYIKNPKFNIADSSTVGILWDQQAGTSLGYKNFIIENPEITYATAQAGGNAIALESDDAGFTVINPKISVIGSGAAGVWGIFQRLWPTNETAIEGRVFSPEIYTFGGSGSGFNRGIDLYQKTGSAAGSKLKIIGGGLITSLGDNGEACKNTNDNDHLTGTYSDLDLGGVICNGSAYDLRSASAFGDVARFYGPVFLAHNQYVQFDAITQLYMPTSWVGGIIAKNGYATATNASIGLAGTYVFDIAGVAGGVATGTGTKVGGVGQPARLVTGTGGTCPNAATQCTGGASGSVDIRSAAGASVSAVTVAAIAGASGDYNDGPGDGGTATNGSSSNTGGGVGNRNFYLGQTGTGFAGTQPKYNWIATGKETISLDLGTTANEAAFSTTTGVTEVNFVAMSPRAQASSATTFDQNTSPAGPKLYSYNSDATNNNMSSVILQTVNATTGARTDMVALTSINNSHANGVSNANFNIGILDTGTFKSAAFFDGANNRMGIGGDVAPSYAFSLDGTFADMVVGLERHSVNFNNGRNVTLQGGGATVGGTDKNGGDARLSGGIATGTGSSNATFYTATPQASTNTTDNTPSEKGHVNGKGQLEFTGTAPALSSCGGSPSILGTDNAMSVTVGSAITTCTITFNKTWANSPHCNVTERTGTVVNPLTYTVSTSAITLNQTALNGNVLDINCVGHY